MTSIESFLVTSEDKIKLFFNAIPIPTYVWQKVREDFVLIDYNNAAFWETDGKIKNFAGIKASEYYKDKPFIIEFVIQFIRLCIFKITHFIGIVEPGSESIKFIIFFCIEHTAIMLG